MAATETNAGTEPLALTVAIGTYNGARTLARALEALEHQEAAPPHEVIVVDDGSTDATGEIARGFPVRYECVDPNRGHAHALNVALELARGRILACMDDDCVPPPNWLANLAAAWDDAPAGVTCLGGPVQPAEVDTFNRRFVAYRQPLRPQEAGLDETAGFTTRLRYAFAPPQPPTGARVVYFPVGANLSVKVEAARAVGGFVDRPGAGEEEALCRKLRERFGPSTVWFDPRVEMAHDFHPNLDDTFRRARSYGRASGFAFVDRGGMPSVRVVPVAALVAVVATAWFSLLAAVATLVAAPLVLYRGWWGRFRQHEEPEFLAYPYLMAAEDVVTNWGFLQGWRRRRRSAR